MVHHLAAAWRAKNAPMSSDDPTWPRFCCVRLVDAHARWVFEQRPRDARNAAGKVTCLGGTREPGEHPDECIRREIREELGRELTGLAVLTRLTRQGQPLAWFYGATLADPGPLTHLIPGHTLIFLEGPRWAELDLAPWHRAALHAIQDGRPEQSVD